MKKKLSENYNVIIEYMKDMHLIDMTNVIIDKETEQAKRIINIQKLARFIISNVFGSLVDIKDIDVYTKFINSASNAVEKFYDFLDYDNDGVVELVRCDEKGKITDGEDIELMINDVKSVLYSYNITESFSKNVIVVLAQLTAYISNENVIKSRQEFKEFKEECVNAYDAYKQLNMVDYKKLVNNAGNMITFIMNACIILLPIVDMAIKRITISDTYLTKETTTTNKYVTRNLIITKDDIKKASDNMYGCNIEYILAIVDNLVTTISASIAKSDKVISLFKQFKLKCCCCVDSNNVA